MSGLIIGGTAVNLTTITATSITLTGNSSIGGTENVVGNFSVNTSMFTVTASNGNTAVAGTLGVTSDFAVNTNKFTVAASSGNTAIAGTLVVSSTTNFNGAVAINAGATVAAGTTAINASFQIGGVTSPAQITGNVTDYAPAGITTTSILRLDLDANHTLNSLGANVANKVLWIVNISAFTLTIHNDDGATGTAALRIRCPGNVDYSLLRGSMVPLWYDGTSTRWQLIR